MKYIPFITIVTISIMFGEGGVLANYDGRFEARSERNFLYISSTDTVSESSDTISVPVYPAQPLIRSLIFPGWGQLYNKSPWWKTTLFAGIEAAGIFGWWQWKNKAEDIRLNYEKFADDYWNLERWINYSEPLLEAVNESLTSMGYNPVDDINLGGTHQLEIIYGEQIISSTCFEYDPTDPNDCYIPFDQSMTEIRDRDFYENIGKYDQFVAGWEDAISDFEIKFKDVGDSTEIIITTPLKNDYLSQRQDSNKYLNLATYAVSTIMFNHVFSALEAVWFAQNKSREEDKVKTSVGIFYDRKSRYGVGGLALVVTW